MNFGFGHESSSRRSLDTLVCALWGYSFENEYWHITDVSEKIKTRANA